MMDEIRPSEGADIKDIWEDYMFSTGKTNDTFYGRIALGNGTAYDIGMMWVDPERDGDTSLLVSIVDKGAYTFSRDVHWSYAMEKLRLLKWDAENLADFINRQLGLSGKPQGHYIKSCAKSSPTPESPIKDESPDPDSEEAPIPRNPDREYDADFQDPDDEPELDNEDDRND